MITFDANGGEAIQIDPADARGPWTITLPEDAGNGTQVTVETLTLSTIPVTIRVRGAGDLIQDPSLGVPVPTVDIAFQGGAASFIYNDVTEMWSVFSTYTTRAQTGGGGSGGSYVMISERLQLTADNTISDISEDKMEGFRNRLFLYVNGLKFTADVTPGVTLTGRSIGWNPALTGYDLLINEDPVDHLVAYYPIASELMQYTEVLPITTENQFPPLRFGPVPNSSVQVSVNSQILFSNITPGLTRTNEQLLFNPALIGWILRPGDHVEVFYEVPGGANVTERLTVTTFNVIPPMSNAPLVGTNAQLNVNGQTLFANLTDGLTQTANNFTWDAAEIGWSIDPHDVVTARYQVA